MIPAKVNVLIAQFAYGGNGGIPMVLPTQSVWMARTFAEMDKDERIGKVAIQQLSDTPIPMMRNRAVKIAREGGFDFILMLDSDNTPDIEIDSDVTAKPFWKTSFDFVYNKLVQGMPTLVAAPYCGPPPHENVYVFYWEGFENSPHCVFKVQPYSRDTAIGFSGILPVAAGPTGVTLYATKVFDLMRPPYFYYEYSDEPYQTDKASTEDVTNFRDLNILGLEKHGIPVVYCNWDSWAGHTKVKTVRKPACLTMENVNSRLKAAMNRFAPTTEEMIDIDFAKKLPHDMQVQLTNGGAVLSPEAESGDCAITDAGAYETPNSTEEGIIVRKRIVGDRVVTSVGHETPACQLDTLRQLVASLSRRVKPARAVRAAEVGSWVGESAVAISQGFTVPGSTLFCVDDFSGGGEMSPLARVVNELGSDGIERFFRKNIEGLEGTIRLIRGQSVDIANSLDPSGLDFVFIDAGHDYENVKSDILSWLPHVDTDGVLMGHDYHEAWPGVIQALEEVFDPGIIKVFGNTSIWMVKIKDYQRWLKKSSSPTKK